MTHLLRVMPPGVLTMRLPPATNGWRGRFSLKEKTRYYRYGDVAYRLGSAAGK